MKLVTDTIFIQSKDTIFVHSLDPELVRHYTDILEKTNSQLSLWSNPYGIFFAGLGIFVTLFTIVAAIIHFKQTNDYKNQVNTTIDRYRSIIDSFIQQKDKALDTLVQDKIQAYKDEMGQKGEGDPKYKELEEKIKALEETKIGISNISDSDGKKRRSRRPFRTQAELAGICPKCHALIQSDAGYCTVCGTVFW